MTAAWPFLALGLLLLILAILLLRRAAPSEHDPSESSEEGDTKAALYPEFPSQRLVDRLFGSEDWEFIAKQESAQLKRLFLQQRRALALSLLRGARANATKLIRAHSAAARKTSHLQPLIELRVISDYLVLQMLCRLTASVIWLRGPVAMGRLVGYADGFSQRFYEVVRRAFPVELAYGNSNRPPAPAGARKARGR